MVQDFEGVAVQGGNDGASPPRAAGWCLAPFHLSGRGFHFRIGHRCVLSWASVARRARAKRVGCLWLLDRMFR